MITRHVTKIAAWATMPGRAQRHGSPEHGPKGVREAGCGGKCFDRTPVLLGRRHPAMGRIFLWKKLLRPARLHRRWKKWALASRKSGGYVPPVPSV